MKQPPDVRELQSTIGREATWSFGLPVLAAVVCTACTSLTYESNASLSRIMDDIGVPAGDIRFHGPVDYGRTRPGVDKTSFFPAILVITGNSLLLLDRDESTRRYVTAQRLDIASMSGVALERSLGKAQVQIADRTTTVVLQPGGWPIRGTDDAEHIYTELRGIGIPEIPGIGWVSTRTEPGPVIIPVYIPAK